MIWTWTSRHDQVEARWLPPDSAFSELNLQRVVEMIKMGRQGIHRLRIFANATPTDLQLGFSTRFLPPSRPLTRFRHREVPIQLEEVAV